jgi:hypothetical protein
VVSGVAFPVQPVVQLRDASNNAVAKSGVSVTAALATGSGTLGGTATITTNASGVATFTNLSVAGTGAYTLRFSATGLTPATSSSINVTAAPPVGASPEPAAGDVILIQDNFERAAGSIASGYSTRGSVSATTGNGGGSAIRFNYSNGDSDNLIEKSFAETKDIYIRYWYRLSPNADPTCGGHNGSGFKWFMTWRGQWDTPLPRYTMGVGNLDGSGNNAGLEFSTHDNGSTAMPNPFLQNKTKTPRFATTRDGQWHKYTLHVVVGAGGYEQIWVDGTLVLDSSGFGYDHNANGIAMIQFPGAVVDFTGCANFTVDVDDFVVWHR